MKTVMAAERWPSNAELIEDCAQLGYIQGRVLDPASGDGVFWKNYQPTELVTHDIDPEKPSYDGVDFRDMPHEDESFDTVVYDPPYVAPGGRKTSTIGDFNSRYGIDNVPSTPAKLQRYTNTGVNECYRVLRRGTRMNKGWFLVKTCDYVSSGKVWWGVHHTLTYCLELDFRLVDRFEFIGNPRAQPGERTRKCEACEGLPGADCTYCGGTGRVPSTQQHARRNLSTLLVFRKHR